MPLVSINSTCSKKDFAMLEEIRKDISDGIKDHPLLELLSEQGLLYFVICVRRAKATDGYCCPNRNFNVIGIRTVLNLKKPAYTNTTVDTQLYKANKAGQNYIWGELIFHIQSLLTIKKEQ